MKSNIFINLKIKIIVIIFAIFIWFFVETENNYTYSFKIPIKVSNLASDKIIVNDIPSHVKVKFWGKGRLLLALILNQKLHYNIDLTNINESIIFKLNKTDVRLPRASSIEILNVIEPDSVFVKIVDLEKKKVPVKSNISIVTVPGYSVIDGIQFESDSIEIVGAQTYLDSVSFIETESIILKKVKRDIRKNVKLIPPKVEYVWQNERELSFFVDVQKIMEKPLTNIPVYIINTPPKVELTAVPSVLSLTLIGGVDELLPITERDIAAYIDYNKVRNSKEIDHLAYIDKPDGIRIKEIKPKRFKIISKKIRLNQNDSTWH